MKKLDALVDLFVNNFVCFFHINLVFKHYYVNVNIFKTEIKLLFACSKLHECLLQIDVKWFSRKLGASVWCWNFICACSFARLQDELLNQIRQIVRDEVVVVLRDQQAALHERLDMALRSGTATPVNFPVDPQQRQQNIAALLRQGKFNHAFQLVRRNY